MRDGRYNILLRCEFRWWLAPGASVYGSVRSVLRYIYDLYWIRPWWVGVCLLLLVIINMIIVINMFISDLTFVCNTVLTINFICCCFTVLYAYRMYVYKIGCAFTPRSWWWQSSSRMFVTQVLTYLIMNLFSSFSLVIYSVVRTMKFFNRCLNICHIDPENYNVVYWKKLRSFDINKNVLSYTFYLRIEKQISSSCANIV